MVKIKCQNCGFIGEPKEFNGQKYNLCPKCLFNKMVDYYNKEEKTISTFNTNFEGDGSVGIQGSISLRDKESAITFIIGIMEQFDIEPRELEY